MVSSLKKVVVRTAGDRMADVLYCGYLGLNRFVTGTTIDLLNLDGRIVVVPFASVRWIAFVRDFNLGDKQDPERLTRRTFPARPRAEGLWLRLTLAEGDVIDGLASLDISLMDELLEDGGVFVIPPDIRSNTQRLFVPRHTIAHLKIMAVITAPSRSKPAKGDLPTQESLFSDHPGL